MTPKEIKEMAKLYNVSIPIFIKIVSSTFLQEIKVKRFVK